MAEYEVLFDGVNYQAEEDGPFLFATRGEKISPTSKEAKRLSEMGAIGSKTEARRAEAAEGFDLASASEDDVRGLSKKDAEAVAKAHGIDTSEMKKDEIHEALLSLGARGSAQGGMGAGNEAALGPGSNEGQAPS